MNDVRIEISKQLMEVLEEVKESKNIGFKVEMLNKIAEVFNKIG